MNLELDFSFKTLMQRVFIPLALIVFAASIVFVSDALLNQPPVQAEQGTLDLRGWNPNEDTVQLAGEWSFYWDRYLTPEEVKTTASDKFFVLPGIWNQQVEPYPIQGHATYALDIALPDEELYTLKVPILSNRYRLWINGEIMLDDDLSQTIIEHTDSGRPRFFNFQSRAEGNQIVFHILNDRHRGGGIWEHLRIARAEQSFLLKSGPVLFDASAAFLLSLLAFVLFFVAYKEDSGAYIYLSLFAGITAIRAGTVNERLLFTLLHIQDWELQQTLEHLSLYLSFPFFALFLGKRYPSYFPPVLHWATVCICSVLALIVLITPASVFTHTAPIFQVNAVLFTFFWFGAISDHVNKDPRALVLVGSGVLFITAGINDIFYNHGLIDSANLVHVGAMLFIAASTFLRFDMEREETTQNDASNANPSHVLATPLQKFMSNQSEEDKRQLAAQALNHSLFLWETNLGKSKLEFAEQSGLWRITNDSGTLKTRTLDKYLKEENMPQSPRYKSVVQSIHFVIEQPLPQEEIDILKNVASSLM